MEQWTIYLIVKLVFKNTFKMNQNVINFKFSADENYMQT